MPLYTFFVQGDPHPTTAELRDDDAAWGQAVRACGELLREIDGSLAANSELRIDVCEHERRVVTMRVWADRAVSAG